MHRCAFWPLPSKRGWFGCASPAEAYVGLLDGLPLAPPGYSFMPTWHDDDLRIVHYQLFDQHGRTVRDWPPLRATKRA